MRLLSLFIVVLASIALSLACHPECSCEAATAPARCLIFAKPINCSILCANSSHLSSCQGIHCWYRAPVDQCEQDACPQLEVKCRPPICTAHLADCQIQCEAVQAGWGCEPFGLEVGCSEAPVCDNACSATEEHTVLVTNLFSSSAILTTARFALVCIGVLLVTMM